MKKIFSYLLVAFLWVTSAHAAIIYVSFSGSGSANGTSWANSRTLSTAITNSVAGDSLWLKAETYSHYNSLSLSNATLNLKPGVSLFGGFNGTETAFSQRDVIANKTYISARRNSTTLYNTITVSNGTQEAVIDGVFFTEAGNYTYVKAINAKCIIRNCHVSMRGNFLSDNSHIIIRTLTLDSTQFYNNAVFRTINNGSITILKTNFLNIKDDFNMVDCVSGKVSIDSCSFIKNRNINARTFQVTAGGALNISNCTFIKNSNFRFRSETGIITIKKSQYFGNSQPIGISIFDNAFVYIDSCYFKGNHEVYSTSNIGTSSCIAIGGSGTGLAINGHIKIDSCTFLENKKSPVHIGGWVEASVQNCLFEKDTSDYGAAIRLYERGHLTGRNLLIKNNHAVNAGGAIFALTSSSVNLTDCIIQNNTTGIYGGGSILQLSGSTNSTVSGEVYRPSSLNNCKFLDNKGMAIVAGRTKCTVYFCEFINNQADGNGGALQMSESNRFRIYNSKFINNRGLFKGGAIYSSSLYNSTRDTLELTNCLFTGNSANQTGGISHNNNCLIKVHNCTFHNNYNITNNFEPSTIRGSGNDNYSTITNSIISGNESPQIAYFNDQTVSYSIVTDGPSYTNSVSTADPLFEDSSNNNFRLSDLSPAINAGTPDTSGLKLGKADLDSLSRVAGGRIDIGAYEKGASVLSISKTHLVKNELAVYPTIARNEIHLSYPYTDLSYFTILNSEGKAVQSGTLSKASSYTICTTDLNPGLYVIVAGDVFNKEISGKFIKE